MKTATAHTRPHAGIAVILFAVSTAAVTWTIFVPLMVVHLERMQTSTFLIGVATSIWALPIFVLGPVYPKIIARFGAIPSLTAGMLVSAAAIVVFPLFPNVYVWIGLNVLSGAAQGHFWILAEAWINQVTPEPIRGRITALYSALPAGASALGPLILLRVGFDGVLPFAVAAGFLVIALAPLYLFTGIAPPADGSPPPALRRLLAPAFALMVIAFVAGVFEDGAVGLLPVFALGRGLSEDAAVATLTALLLGRCLLIYPIGHLADRYDRSAVLLATSVVTVLCLIVMPAAAAQVPLLMLVVFLWGAVSGAFYSLGLALLGSRFRANALTAANALFIVAHSVGLVVGPPAAGLAMDAWGPWGFVAALSLGALAVIGVVAGRSGRPGSGASAEGFSE